VTNNQQLEIHVVYVLYTQSHNVMHTQCMMQTVVYKQTTRNATLSMWQILCCDKYERK